MLVRELRFEQFRNLHPGQFRPSPGVNILYGDNAQGKTNLLEACWLFTGARSFRGAKDGEMIAFGKDHARLHMDFFSGNREQTAEITIQQRRQVQLNGVRLPSAARLTGSFCGIVFSPSHLSLIKDGPEGRRRFVDGAYCQLRPGYVNTLAEYNKVLAQRNHFLKNTVGQGLTSGERDMLALWNSTLAVAGARVTTARRHYITRLEPLAATFYDGLSGGRETLRLEWLSPALEQTAADASPAQIARGWLAALEKAQRDDVSAGFSTVGAHREDLQLLLNEKPVRIYGSQGQQRSAVLALKLAEATLLQEVIGEPPVAFLDDVMSELDVSRQDYILNHIHDWQVFLTCCEPSTALRMNAGQVFCVKQGVISS